MERSMLTNLATETLLFDKNGIASYDAHAMCQMGVPSFMPDFFRKMAEKHRIRREI
jgi:hypothetical protein